MNTLQQNLNTLNQLANQSQDTNLDIDKSLEIFQQGIAVAEQCLEQLTSCKGKLTILQDKAKELTNDN